MALSRNFHKWDVVVVNLDPAKGSEIRKTRPCVIISPDVLNKHIKTVIIAPFTSSHKGYPCRVNTNFNNVSGELCLDQIKSIDKSRIIKSVGKLDKSLHSKVSKALEEMFRE